MVKLTPLLPAISPYLVLVGALVLLGSAIPPAPVVLFWFSAFIVGSVHVAVVLHAHGGSLFLLIDGE